MAELAAISAAASIIQLIDFTSRVVRRLKDYSDHAADVPKAFRQVSIELPVLRHTLQRLKEAFDGEIVSPDLESTILPALRECLSSIQKLDSLLGKAVVKEDDSWGRRHGKALKSLFHDSEVERLVRDIREHVRNLTFASMPLDTFSGTKIIMP